jgi:hypothetical protein
MEKRHAVSLIAADDSATVAASAPVRALSAQLKELRRRHSDEVAALQQALALVRNVVVQAGSALGRCMMAGLIAAGAFCVIHRGVSDFDLTVK